MKKAYLMMLSTASVFANDLSSIKSSNVQCLLDASFTYWQAKEDGLNAAESAQVDTSGTTIFANSPAVFKQDFGFNPGFKVGLGFSYANDWIVKGEYTYYRGTTQVSRSAPAGSTGVGVWSLDSWYNQKTFYSNQSLTGTELSTTWKIAMNMGDLLFTRPISQEKIFTYAPFGGLRTVWIHQRMDLSLIEDGTSWGGTGFLGPQPTTSKNSSHAWAIGPRLGTEARVNLPSGFNLNALAGVSVLFEKFTRVRHSETAASIYYEAPAPIDESYDCVRPELDMNLGFGWGMELCKKKRVDLALSYDFMYFWGQNMMRYFVDEFFAGTSAGSLDLYFQGLTFKATYAF